MPPQPAPLDSLRKQENAMQELLATQVDVEAPESFPLYFHLLYNKHVNLGTAFKGWLSDNARDFQFQFREAAHAFRMIDDQASAAVFVRYGENEALLRSLLAAG